MKTVIMIDDDASILDIFKVVFERAGYEVQIFNSPELILGSQFKEPDIFIIDKQLGGTNGVNVCRFLKEREPKRSTPIIIFSATTKIDEYARSGGADDFLEKPFKTKELLAMVEKHLGKHAA